MKMTPVPPSSTSNSLVNPGNSIAYRQDNFLARCSILGTSRKQVLLSHRYTLPMSTSVRLFPQFRIGCALQPRLRTHIISATNTDIAVEEANLPAADKDSGEVSETPPLTTEKIENSPSESDASPTRAQSKRPRPARKSEMPPVKNEDLIPGTTFVGKVRSIQPFGAFVDFGAFTDGLVHVSRLSDGFVKDVGDVVSIGQEVTVKLVEANIETGRISLTMRLTDDGSKTQKQKDASTATSRAPRKFNQKRDEGKKSSKFVKGQELDGTVKNLVRAGAFISLPDGEEGFLPASEESDDVVSLIEGSSLQIGQEVKVRVLNISRGKVQLTMKKEETSGEFEVVQGVVHAATNPFVLAFQRNKDISAFLDEREKLKENKPTDQLQENVLDLDSSTNMVDKAETSEKGEDQESLVADSPQDVDNTVKSIDEEAEPETLPLESTISAATDVLDDVQTINEDVSKEDTLADSSQNVEGALGSLEYEPTDQLQENVASASLVDNDETTDTYEDKDSLLSDFPQDVDSSVKSTDEELESTIAPSQGTTSAVGDMVDEADTINEDKSKEDILSDSSQSMDKASQTLDEEPEGSSDALAALASTSSVDQITELLPATEKVENSEIFQLSQAIIDQSSSSESLIVEDVANDKVEDVIGKDELQAETTIQQEELLFTAEDEAEPEVLNLETNGTTSGSGSQVDDASNLESISKEGAEVIENKSNVAIEVDGVQAKGPLVESEVPFAPTITAGKIGPDLAKSENTGELSEPSGTTLQKETSTKAAISPALVKQLREETGAGMMDCKRALAETGGDMVKAQEYLRKKGLASADKKASRITAEGRIGSYIHDSRIGVLVEVNCETDFVSRGDIFKDLVEDLAMQVAACPQVQYLVPDDVPKEIADKEREIEMQKEDLLSKPEQIRSKIVDGRIRKRLEELALLEQPYIKNDKMVVNDLVKQTIATVGENIKVKRFMRYNLGEGLEKKSQDFAAEVAAQTSAKPAAPKKEEPAAVEAKEPVEKPVKATISPALVKQLREETGAGMMDCKKALSETGGDLEKAQEYLRKKGLSSAEKKSSRLAAEGRIGSYIHDGRIGVLIEVNCETDFVGRSENFKNLVDDLAMQVVACPQVHYVSVEDIPAAIVNKEKELEMLREDLQSRPENIRERIVEGRVSKRLGELALLEQPFIKNDTVLVKDLVKQTVAALGENIKVRRFVRFTLGEESKPESGEEAAVAAS